MKKLIIIAGPSGSGKTTVSQYLTEKYQIPRVITHTTRPKRPDEKSGVDYFFETPESFAKLHFFEKVKYGSYQYGSSKESLDETWKDHDFASLVVDTKGAKSYLDQLGDQVIFIYIEETDKNKLKQRLIDRGDDEKEIELRLKSPEFLRDLNLSSELKKHAVILKNDDLTATQRALDQLIDENKG